MTNSEKSNQMANAIRFLSAEAVEKANSGHPGLPMGAADIATVLYTRFLKFDPKAPHWPDRDRFILSAGHGSMLLYSLLYLTGYEDMTIEEIKNFRQLGSRTAGHPEYGHASGIETTTGPLGQGLANSVGMALSERIMNAHFGDDLVNHYTYVIAGDGCLMEGISQEAIALAGHLKLNKLIVFWDHNNISIDGPVSLADNTDQCARVEASGWNSLQVDGHDQDADRRGDRDRPQVRQADTHRLQDDDRFWCADQGSARTRFTARRSGQKNLPVPARRLAGRRTPSSFRRTSLRPGAVQVSVLPVIMQRGSSASKPRIPIRDRSSNAVFAVIFQAISKQTIVAYKKKLSEDKPKVATRKASEMALEVINGVLAETIGGSADLTGSNNTEDQPDPEHYA